MSCGQCQCGQLMNGDRKPPLEALYPCELIAQFGLEPSPQGSRNYPAGCAAVDRTAQIPATSAHGGDCLSIQFHCVPPFLGIENFHSVGGIRSEWRVDFGGDALLGSAHFPCRRCDDHSSEEPAKDEYNDAVDARPHMIGQ